MSVELVDADRQLPIAYRNTIANMMAEAEALNGIFAPDDDHATRGIAQKGIDDAAVSADRAGRRRALRDRRDAVDLDDVRPMIAKPFSPGNAFPAEEVARERITFDKAMIGSCTNGSYDDLLQAALVLRAARGRGATQGRRASSSIFPGSGGVGRQIERPDPRLGGESIAEVFRSVGGEIRQSWCGPCFGQGPDALDAGPARDHVVQSQLAEPHGPRRRRLPREPRRRRRVGARRLHGAAERARAGLGSGNLRRLVPNWWRQCTRVRSSDPALNGPEASPHWHVGGITGDTASIDGPTDSGLPSARSRFSRSSLASTTSSSSRSSRGSCRRAQQPARAGSGCSARCSRASCCCSRWPGSSSSPRRCSRSSATRSRAAT